jgi:hypothetical protein
VVPGRYEWVADLRPGMTEGTEMSWEKLLAWIVVVLLALIAVYALSVSVLGYLSGD